MKRVITGVDPGRKSVIQVDDQPNPTVEFGPGFAVTDLWRVEEPPSAAADGHVPTNYAFEPERGAVFRVVVIPPDAVVWDSIGRGEQWGHNSPYRETGTDYGQHSTSTQDYVSVVSGKVDLRMPDGNQVRLTPGDVVIQRGATHAWRNPGPDAVVLHVVMLGTGHHRVGPNTQVPES